MIDTRTTVLRLTSAGFDRRQAEALANVLQGAFGDTRATKADLSLTMLELDELLQRTKWRLVGSQLIISGALFVALKVIH